MPSEHMREEAARAQHDVDSAMEKLQTAQKHIWESNTKVSGSAEEIKETSTQVAETEASVKSYRVAVRRLGGLGTGTTEADPPDLSSLPGPEEGISASQKAAVEKLQPRELDEVRKLSRPPAVVRRALELVQTLLKMEDGEAVDASSHEAEWPELQAMIAAPGFVKRVTAMKPLAISLKPAALAKTVERWPGLLGAADTAAKRPGKWSKLGDSRSTGSLKSRLAMSQPSKPPAPASGPAAATFTAAAEDVVDGAVDASDAAAPTDAAASAAAAPAANPAKRTSLVTGSRLNAAIAAAAAEAKPDGALLTVESVDYASRPVGSIFRWCASVANQAVTIKRERDAAQLSLDQALARMVALERALSTCNEYYATLSEEEKVLERAQREAQAVVDRAKELHAAAAERAAAASNTLEEGRKAAQQAANKAKQGEDAELRRREDAVRRKADKAEKEAATQEAIARDLATRPTKSEINSKKLAWVFEHQLPSIPPLEFGESMAALSADAPIALARIAKELQSIPSLKLHIAGHVAPDEDPKLSSQRAQAVGAALIALGAMPSRLRAKGYGCSVGLTATMKARLKLKSERRVGLHAIHEVSTKYPLEFEPRRFEIGPQGVALLNEIATLMRDAADIRLSIEGHADDVGEASGNAKLSVNRAQGVLRHLHSLGVDPNRLVAHGFGSALPIADNTADEGRARNRRVQFLVIPDVKQYK